jgi:uncharacterized protein HemY
MGENTIAAESFIFALESNNYNESTYIDIARSFYAKNDIETTLFFLEEGLARHPDQYFFAMSLADLYYKNNDYISAQKNINKALELKPGSSEAINMANQIKTQINEVEYKEE